MKFIDADKLLKELPNDYGDCFATAYVGQMRDIVEDQPEAIVRCKDCASYGIEYCGKLVINCTEDFYCALGEEE